MGIWERYNVDCEGFCRDINDVKVKGLDEMVETVVRIRRKTEVHIDDGVLSVNCPYKTSPSLGRAKTTREGDEND